MTEATPAMLRAMFLGPVPRVRGIHRSGQRDFAMRDVDLDLRRLG
jgi:hypothetical protein